MPWKAVSGLARTGNRVPMVRWGKIGSECRAIARLNTAASHLAQKIVSPPDEIGIRVVKGMGADDGKFALEIVPYPIIRRWDPLVVLLHPIGNSRNTTFSGGPLASMQEFGQSRLVRHGNALIGRLGDLEGIGMARRVATVEESFEFDGDEEEDLVMLPQPRHIDMKECLPHDREA